MTGRGHKSTLLARGYRAESIAPAEEKVEEALNQRRDRMASGLKTKSTQHDYRQRKEKVEPENQKIRSAI